MNLEDALQALADLAIEAQDEGFNTSEMAVRLKALLNDVSIEKAPTATVDIFYSGYITDTDAYPAFQMAKALAADQPTMSYIGDRTVHKFISSTEFTNLLANLFPDPAAQALFP